MDNISGTKPMTIFEMFLNRAYENLTFIIYIFTSIIGSLIIISLTNHIAYKTVLKHAPVEAKDIINKQKARIVLLERQVKNQARVNTKQAVTIKLIREALP